MTTIAERLVQIANSNAREGNDQIEAFEDAYASYLINALDTMAEQGIPPMYRPKLVALYNAAWDSEYSLAERTSKPTYGSQEWAETRGDDLGESPDY